MRSIKSRFVATLTSNVLRTGLTFLTTIILARALGPAAYGELVFLLGSFAASRQILDAGTSTAFYTFLSQRPRGRQFLLTYFLWLLAQFLIPLVLIGLLFPDAWIEHIWRGYDKLRVLEALVAVFLQQQLWQAITQIGESTRRNVSVQAMNLAVALAHLSLIALGWYLSLLSVGVVLAFIGTEYLLVLLLGYRLFVRPALREPTQDLRSLLADYFTQCRPLVIYAWVGFAYSFFDNWMLNRFAGAQEQAYFSMANQFALLCLVPTTALLQIYWKEVAEAHDRNQPERIVYLFEKAARGVYAMTAMICGLVLPWSQEIMQHVLGSAYQEGWPILALMLIFALHVSLSQVTSATMFAAGEAGWQTRWGIGYMLVSIPFSYLVLAPANAPVPGLDLGAAGMAFKVLVLQFLLVNATLWWMAHRKGWRVSGWYQGYVLAITLVPGWLSRQCGVAVWGSDEILSVVLSGVTSAAIYLTFLACVIRLRPAWLGLDGVDFGWLRKVFS
jgi:O-antigen/teichoic acid export membrane protein